MQFELRKQRVPLWWIIVGVAILVLFIITFFGSSTPLEGYVDTGEQEIVDNGDIEKELDEPFVVYKHEETGVSLEVPEKWKQIVKDGGKSFIHNESGTSIWVKTFEYHPEINHKNTDFLLGNYLGETEPVEIVSASDINSTSVQIIYVKKVGDTVYDHITTFIWDRENIVMIDTILKDNEYKSFKDILDYVYSSIVIESKTEIAEDKAIYYNKTGKYEFVVPLNWAFGESESTLLLAEEQKGMMISVQAIPTNESLSDFDKLDYTTFASNSRANFILTSYAAGSDYIYAEASFTNASTGENMYLVQELVTTGQIEYIITCEIPYSNAQEMYPEISSFFGSFRYFE